MTDRLGVLLVQLGGPEKREELRPFLCELFADPEVLGIRLAPLRKLAAFAIATLRAPSSAKIYERIGWSPIRRWTAEQARLLEAELKKRGLDAVVRPGMTCSAPHVEDALEELRAAGVTRLVVLPLYPQYSVTTTKSSFERVDADLEKMKWAPAVRRAPDFWYAEPGFLDAHAARIRDAAAKLPDPDPAKTTVLYSAHSLPVSTVEKKKDPYPKQVEATVAALDERLAHAYPSTLGYQSRVGPVPWIGPATQDVIARLAKDEVKQVVAVPIAFVSDHVETLFEIRLLFGEQAARLGIPHFAAADGLNDHPDFIRALAGIVTKAAA
jgi:ferrochelatase